MTGEIAPSLSADSGLDRTADREEERQIDRARCGQAEAIDWLLVRYRPRVVRLSAHILRRPGEAEDVAQEAFVRAFRNLHTYRGEGRFYTWLYQIVVRVCLDRRRLARWTATSSFTRPATRSPTRTTCGRSASTSRLPISSGTSGGRSRRCPPCRMS